MNKNKIFVKDNVMPRDNIFNNILVPTSKKLNIILNKSIVQKCLHTIQNDIDFDYILSKSNYDITKINNMLVNTLIDKYGITNNKYSDKADE